jgi:hypothetical protein
VSAGHRPAVAAFLGVAAALAAAPLHGQSGELPPRVAPVYLVPRDQPFDVRRMLLQLQAVADVQQWYAAALSGPTFFADPLIVHRSRYTFAELAADDFQAWWPRLEEEFRDLGMPWNDHSDIKLLMLAQSAGGWAGGDSENGGITAPTDAGTTDHGSLGGLVVIGDSSVAGVLAGVCPADGITGGTVWWCNWDTYRGTVAHELGHTWGIPHPDAFLVEAPDRTGRRWDCGSDGNTVMQCHWGFPHDTLLDYERRHLRSLRYFADDADAAYTPLVEVLEDSAGGFRRLYRPGLARDSASAAAWIRRADGGITGYPTAVALGAGAWIRWTRPDGCGLLAAAVGRAAEGGGRGAVEILVDDEAVARFEVAGDGVTEILAAVCPTGSLVLRVSGDDRFIAVVGSPRVYPDLAGTSAQR